MATRNFAVQNVRGVHLKREQGDSTCSGEGSNVDPIVSLARLQDNVEFVTGMWEVRAFHFSIRELCTLEMVKPNLFNWKNGTIYLPKGKGQRHEINTVHLTAISSESAKLHLGLGK